LKLIKIIGLTFSMVVVSCVPLSTTEDKSTLKYSNSPGVSGDQKAASIAAFKSTVYPLVRSMSCVNCHGDAKKYQPYYAISDAEGAWKNLTDANKVNLDSPESSRIYLRIKNDLHNCLTDTSDAECDTEAANMLTAIKKWKSLVNYSSASKLRTGEIPFVDAMLTNADIENGTLLLEAEQTDFASETLFGRFLVELDSRALSNKYVYTPMPEANPNTLATRTASIVKGSNCEVTTSTMLSNSQNGPYRISEEGTHINSGRTTPGGLIRPDKRMTYAKMLTGWSAGVASGTGTITNLDSILIKDSSFDFTTANINVTSSGRVKTQIDISDVKLTGNSFDKVAFKTLPYFIPRAKVFDTAGAFLNTPNADIVTYKGQTLKLKNIFKLPMEQFTPADIIAFFETNEADTMTTTKFRKDILYRFVTDYMTSLYSTTNKYTAIENMDTTHMYSLYGNLKLDIKACPSGVCTSTTQVLEVTPGTDSDGVVLTYDNALDILKVNAAGTGFVTGTQAELNAGKAFRRLDIYAYTYEGTTSKTYGDNFNQIFYDFSTGAYTTKATVNFPLNVAAQNIDLKAFYIASTSSLSASDNLANFQATLYPVIQKAACISCHAGSQPARVQHSNSNPLTAFNEIIKYNLVNFTKPAKSFRLALYPTESSIAHNCGTSDADCSKTQAAFIAAIEQWNTANQVSLASSVAVPYKVLSESERAPGMLQYKFNAKKTGYYNIWTKVKSANGMRLNLRVMEQKITNGVTSYTDLKTYSGIKTPALTANSCITYTYPEYTDWTWFTPGRSDDLTKLDSRGTLKKDSNNVSLVLADNRTYWKLETGKTYMVQFFETAPNMKVDSISIDYVAGYSDLLDYQPDLLARDENNIAEYKKRVLTYDISNMVGLTGENKAYFKVEVKTALGGLNYVFRNPRFVSTATNIEVKGIKVLINGQHSFSDASWDTINYITGDDKILTYAPLTTLVSNGPTKDTFSFVFDKLTTSNSAVADIDPRGTAPIISSGRSCRELNLFINTVKPILRNARLMLKDTDAGYLNYITGYPGSDRGNLNNPTTYQCMTCHNDTHPYFKMTTFDYPEILCSQALSRVDFTNYRDSLLVRGIDGSGTHPKLHFIEELEYTSDLKSVVDYNAADGTRILNGYIKNQAGTDTRMVSSRFIAGAYFNTYTPADLGLGNVWSSLSTTDQEYARTFVGQLKHDSFISVPDLKMKTYYEPLVHDDLIGKTLLENDNLTTGLFNKNGVNMYDVFTPTRTTTMANLNNLPYHIVAKKDANNKTVRDANGKIYDSAYTYDQTIENFEKLKSQYRDAILRWIAAEHQHIIDGN